MRISDWSSDVCSSDLLAAGIETRITASDGGLAVEVRFAEPERDPDHYFSEFWTIIWHRLACWLADETISLLSAEFDYARPDAYFEEFQYLFPCRHRFDGAARQIAMVDRQSTRLNSSH